MNCLEERILKDGVVKEGNVLKVDSFLNHQMDVELFHQMGLEWKELFKDKPINKILTIEASGIGIACVAAEYAERAAQYLRSSLSFQVSVIGPTTASISRLQNRYRYQCLIKYKIEPNLIPVLLQLIKMYRSEWIKKGIVLTVDLDPTMI